MKVAEEQYVIATGAAGCVYNTHILQIMYISNTLHLSIPFRLVLSIVSVKIQKTVPHGH